MNDLEGLISQLQPYKNKENWDEVIKICTRIIKEKPKLAEIYNERGLAYIYKSLFEYAVVDFSLAIKHKPNFAEAYASRGVIYSLKGIHHRAIEDLNRAIEIKPDFEEAHKNLEMAKKSIKQ